MHETETKKKYNLCPESPATTAGNVTHDCAREHADVCRRGEDQNGEERSDDEALLDAERQVEFSSV